jgi:hypothetical protein
MKRRYTIAFKGLAQGTHRFEFQVDDAFWAAHPEGEIRGGEVNVEVVLEKGAAGVGSARGAGSAGGVGSAAGAMRLEVAMRGSVVVMCDRCLEDCELPVSYGEKLAVKFSNGVEEGGVDWLNERSEGDILWLNPGDGELDLEQYIYESIVLSLPLQRVHPEDVHGQPLCNPAMLGRFKIVSEEEFETLTDTVNKLDINHEL